MLGDFLQCAQHSRSAATAKEDPALVPLMTGALGTAYLMDKPLRGNPASRLGRALAKEASPRAAGQYSEVRPRPAGEASRLQPRQPSRRGRLHRPRAGRPGG